MTRLMTETVKLDCEQTGLKAALYLHIDRNHRGRPVGFWISSPQKFENSTIDRLVTAINEAAHSAV